MIVIYNDLLNSKIETLYKQQNPIKIFEVNDQ